MKNIKQLIFAILLLVIGIFIGKIYFGNPNSDSSQTIVEKKDIKEEHWTCSMHPQINMPEFGLCPICGMDLIPLEESNDETLDFNQFKMNDYAISLANIQTVIVGSEKSNELSQLNLSGRIIQNENNVVLQTAHIAGRIETLYHKVEGAYMKKGEVIALVYSPDLVTAQNELLQALEIKESQPELYLAIRKKLKNWKLSEREILIIEQTKEVKINYPIVSNVSGFITEIFVKEGNHVIEGSKMYEVSNLNTLWAEFDLFETDLSSIQKNMPISIFPHAFPQLRLNSKIDFIDPRVDPISRTIKIRATLLNTDYRLKPGMIINAKITKNVDSKKKTNIVIPKSAVLWTGKRSIVYIKPFMDQPIFELNEIDLGREFDDQYEVLSGLSNGDELVVNGTFTIDASAQLNNKASMMNLLIMGNVKQEEILPNYLQTTPPAFKKQLENLAKTYLDLKNALVQTDSITSTFETKKLLTRIESVDASLLKDEAYTHWMKDLKDIKEHSKKIVNSSNIEDQRKQFSFLSQTLIKTFKVFGIEGDVIYVQHCPMAFKNKGADWLSGETGIKNPYFGNKMLKCGIVTDTIN